MNETLYHVSSTALSALVQKWEHADKPDPYKFDGFVIKVSIDESSLTFHPLYRDNDDKPVMFVSQLTAGECPNPPGYGDEKSSWDDVLQSKPK